MSSVQKKKQELRDKVLEERKNYSEKEWRTKSKQILARLLNSGRYKNAGVIHTYISMNDRREVWTDPLLEQIFEDEKQAVVPVVNFTEGTLSHTALNSMEELEENHWGVREPDSIKPVDISELELIIVPMAAADRKCNRLGYGKGFYDRFLDKTTAYKIGLTFQDFLFDTIPVEEFDIKLDMIITEEEVILP